LGREKVRVLFLGDSAMRDFFKLARCHVGRCGPGVKASNVTRFFRFSSKIFHVRDKEAALSLAFTASYRLSQSVILELVYVQSRYIPADDPNIVQALCEESQVVLINWALWYRQAGPYYEESMNTALKVLSECSKSNDTIIVYINHPAQHFQSASGRYPPDDRSSKACVPRQNERMDQDIWTEGLRRNVLPGLDIRLISSPWENLTLASCPLPALAGSKERRLHWIPYMDVTQALHRYHKPKPGDCTHLLAIPEFGVPIYDGIYLAVLFETNAKKLTCLTRPPPAQFSTSLISGSVSHLEQTFSNFAALGGYDTRTDFNRDYVLAIQKRLVPIAMDFSKANAALEQKFANTTMQWGH